MTIKRRIERLEKSRSMAQNCICAELRNMSFLDMDPAEMPRAYRRLLRGCSAHPPRPPASEPAVALPVSPEEAERFKPSVPASPTLHRERPRLRVV